MCLQCGSTISRYIGKTHVMIAGVLINYASTCSRSQLAVDEQCMQKSARYSFSQHDDYIENSKLAIMRHRGTGYDALVPYEIAPRQIGGSGGCTTIINRCDCRSRSTLVPRQATKGPNPIQLRGTASSRVRVMTTLLVRSPLFSSLLLSRRGNTIRRTPTPSISLAFVAFSPQF